MIISNDASLINITLFLHLWYLQINVALNPVFVAFSYGLLPIHTESYPVTDQYIVAKIKSLNKLGNKLPIHCRLIVAAKLGPILLLMLHLFTLEDMNRAITLTLSQRQTSEPLALPCLRALEIYNAKAA